MIQVIRNTWDICKMNGGVLFKAWTCHFLIKSWEAESSKARLDADTCFQKQKPATAAWSQELNSCSKSTFSSC